MTDMLHLIEPSIPALRRYARALVRNPATADDLVQDCLERVVGRWHQRRAGSALRPWMFAILHNLAVSHFRQNASRGPHVPLDPLDDAAVGLPPAQEDQLRYQDILEKVAQLPLEQRTVLLLVAVEDLSYADVARVLDIPVGTVMSRLSRARDKLSDLMDQSRANLSPVPHLRRVK